MPRTITDSERANLEQLRLAAKNDDLALVSVRERVTGDERIALAAIGWEDGEYAITPFALMIDGNPFELLDPPAVDGDYYDEEEG